MIQCPHCETSYAPKRLGLDPEKRQIFTVKCMVCGNDFNGAVVHDVVEPSWWRFWQSKTVTPRIETKTRG